jgi:hypothetical protein
MNAEDQIMRVKTIGKIWLRSVLYMEAETVSHQDDPYVFSSMDNAKDDARPLSQIFRVTEQIFSCQLQQLSLH